MNLIKMIKNKLSRKGNNVNNKGNIYSEIIYMSNYINTISYTLRVKQEDSYENKLRVIKQNIQQDEKESLKYSNIIIYIRIPENIILGALLPLIDSNLIKRYFRDEKKDMNLLLSGSIYEFKELFRNSNDLHNSLLLSIKEELYQIESIFFEDFIQDDIMKQIKFGDYSPKDIFMIKDDKIELLDISNIDLIISRLSEMGLYSEDKFTFRDIIDILYIIVNLTGKIEIKQYKAIYEKFQGTLLEWLGNNNLEYLSIPYNTTGETIESLFIPKYKKSSEYTEQNVQKEFYEDVDELVEYRD